MTARIEQIEQQIPYLRNFARSIAQDRTLADDLLQDCLMRAIAKRQTFRSGTNLRAWLSTILSNQFITVKRRAQRWDADIDPEPVLSNLTSQPNQFDWLVLAAVGDGMDDLPEDQSSALRLVGVEGLSYAEASSALGVPVGTVKSRVSRARHALREHLDHGADFRAAA